MKDLSRKEFLTSFACTSALLFLDQNATARPNEIKSSHQYFPSQDPELVQEMVAASHGQVTRVKELLDSHPELAKASWDWGFGDWETALGAASHTGNKEIAELLIANGARPDIFTFTMMGNIGAVKAIIEENPLFQKIIGPHGLTLLFHAKVRLLSKNINDEDKNKAQIMVDYLSTLGGADIKPINLKVSEEEKKQFIGKYKFGENTDDLFIVDINKSGSLTIKAQKQKFERGLFRVGENSFAPQGAPNVEIIFEIKDGQANILTLQDPVPMLKAIRL